MTTITTTEGARVSDRRLVPALGRWTVATLIAGVLLLVYLQVFLVRAFMPPIALMFGVPALILAALVVAIRRRWAPVLGAPYLLRKDKLCRHSTSRRVA